MKGLSSSSANLKRGKKTLKVRATFKKLIFMANFASKLTRQSTPIVLVMRIALYNLESFEYHDLAAMLHRPPFGAGVD